MELQEYLNQKNILYQNILELNKKINDQAIEIKNINSNTSFTYTKKITSFWQDKINKNSKHATSHETTTPHRALLACGGWLPDPSGREIVKCKNNAVQCDNTMDECSTSVFIYLQIDNDMLQKINLTEKYSLINKELSNKLNNMNSVLIKLNKMIANYKNIQHCKKLLNSINDFITQTHPANCYEKQQISEKELFDNENTDVINIVDINYVAQYLLDEISKLIDKLIDENVLLLKNTLLIDRILCILQNKNIVMTNQLEENFRLIDSVAPVNGFITDANILKYILNMMDILKNESELLDNIKELNDNTISKLLCIQQNIKNELNL